MGFDHHPPFNLMLKEQGVEQLAIAVGARQADIVFALKIGGGQRRLRRQRMAGGQHADFIQRQQRGAFGARGVCRVSVRPRSWRWAESHSSSSGDSWGTICRLTSG